MTTRYGFEGGESGGALAPEEPRLAKTVFGRDVHLPSMPGRPTPEPVRPPAAEARVPQATRLSGSRSHAMQRAVDPVAAAPAPPAPESRTERRTPSAPPGVARFLGRRNTRGEIVPLTQTDVHLPRAPWIAPAITVSVAAVASFVLVAGLLWFFRGKASVPRPPAAAVVPAFAAPPVPVPAPAPTTVPPATADVPAAEVPSPPREVGPPAGASTARRPKSRPTRRLVEHPHAADPDAPLPPSFF